MLPHNLPQFPQRKSRGCLSKFKMLSPNTGPNTSPDSACLGAWARTALTGGTAHARPRRGRPTHWSTEALPSLVAACGGERAGAREPACSSSRRHGSERHPRLGLRRSQFRARCSEGPHVCPVRALNRCTWSERELASWESLPSSRAQAERCPLERAEAPQQAGPGSEPDSPLTASAAWPPRLETPLSHLSHGPVPSGTAPTGECRALPPIPRRPGDSHTLGPTQCPASGQWTDTAPYQAHLYTLCPCICRA